MNNLLGLFNQAIAYHQAGKLHEAIDLYLKVLPSQRDNDELLFTIGTACCQVGRLEEGIAYLRKAVRLNPKNFHILGNLGTVLTDLRRFDEAILNYNKAILLNPLFVEGLFGRANALVELKKHAEALADYDRCLALAPNFAVAYCNKGKVLLDLNQNDLALNCFEQAIKLEPRLIEGYCNRAHAFKKLGHVQQAIESYLEAININQEAYGAQLDLAKIYYETGQQTKGDDILKNVEELNPAFFEASWMRVMSKLLLVPKSFEDVQLSRVAFERGLVELSLSADQVKPEEAIRAVGVAQPFYIAYHELENKKLLSMYGELCTQLMAFVKPEKSISPSKSKSRAPLRIGIVSNHICRHSVWDALTRGWVQNLDRTLFDLYFFYTGAVVDEETLYAKSVSAGFFQCGNDLMAWLGVIQQAQIDVLMFPEIGMDPMTVKLASLRLAAVQVVSWGHPETTGLPTIDYYLSSELMEPEASERFYSEKLVKLPNLGCSTQRAKIAYEAIQLEDLGLDVSLPILVCAGTPFKYQPQFDRVLVEIAREIGACQFVFFSYSTNQLSELLKSRIQAEFLNGGVESGSCLHFIPWQTKPAFYSLLSQSDVYLDSIGFSGFNSALQALECSLPVVTREGKFMRGRLASAVLKRIGLNQLIVDDERKYVELVVKLVRDHRFNQNVRQEIQRNFHLVFDDEEPIRALEQFLIEATEQVAKEC